jgi:hypothetical protein
MVAFEASSDLVIWTRLGKGEAVEGIARWVLATSAQPEGRFFRAAVE